MAVDSHVSISMQYSNAFELCYTRMNSFIINNKNTTAASTRRSAIILHTQFYFAPSIENNRMVHIPTLFYDSVCLLKMRMHYEVYNSTQYYNIL